MEHAESAQKHVKAGRAYDFSGLEPLVLEPSRYFRGLMTGMLRQFGFPKPHQAETPEDAFDLLRYHRMDIMFAELAYPPDGIEPGLAFVRKVRRSAEVDDPTLPIVAVTGHAEREQVLAARDAGITEFLAKPLSPDTLFHRVALVVDHPRPFVRADGYVGPDRRRFVHYEYDGPERRGSGAAFEIVGPDPEGRLAAACRDEAVWDSTASESHTAEADPHSRGASDHG